ncbi:MAG: sodium:solute symporter family transporter [Cytophagales bacterium]
MISPETLSMMLTLDTFVFCSFLALNLTVGLWYSRGVKTLRQYAVGNRQFSTIVIALTIVATWYTGAGFIDGRIYGRGLIGTVGILRRWFSLLVLSFLAIRAGEFLNHLTLAEAMGSLYGRAVRKAVAISSILFNIGLIAMQIKVIGASLAPLFDASSVLMIVLLGGILTIYTALGGIKAVTFTDVLQFIIIGLFIPLLTLFMWTNVDTSAFMKTVGAEVNKIREEGLTESERASVVTTILLLSSLGFSAPMFQRLQMAKDVYQARKAFLYATLVGLVLGVFSLCINLLLRYSLPDVSDKLKRYDYLFTTYGTGVFRGVMACGLVAMALSTADSFLNASAVLFANDLVPLTNLYTKQKVVNAKIGAVLVGACSIGVAVVFESLSSIIRLSALFYTPIIIPLILLSLLGFRTSSRVVLMSMGIGLAVGTFCPVVLPIIKGYWAKLVQATFANILTLLLGHYLLGEPGGWGKMKVKHPLMVTKKMRVWWWEQLKSNLSVKVLQERLALNLPKKGEHYFAIGLYAFLSNYVAIYGLDVMHLSSPFFKGILYTLFLATSLLMTYPAWPQFMRSKKAASWVYPLLLMYVFFVAAPVITALGHYQSFYLLLLGSHLIIAILLFPAWMLSTMLCLGIVLDIILFKKVGLAFPAVYATPWQLPIWYSGAMLFVCILVLLRHQATKKKAVLKNYYLQKLHHTMQHEMVNLKSSPERFITRLGYGQYDGLNKLHATFQKYISTWKENGIDSRVITEATEVAEQVKDNATYLDQVMYSLGEGHQTSEEIPIENLLATLRERHTVTQSHVKLLTNKSSRLQVFQGDRDKIEDALAFLVHQAAQKTTSPYLFLAVRRTKILYPNSLAPFDAVAFSLTSQGENPIYKAKYIYEDRPTKILSPISLTAERHYGCFYDLADKGCMLILPANINDIRPKIVKSLAPVGLSSKLALHAKAVESNFWLALERSEKNYNFTRIHLALNIMKAIHGYQLRKSGHLFFTHPIQVAIHVLNYTDEEDVIITALLHDTVEDTEETIEEIGITFGRHVQAMIQALSNLEMKFKKYKVDKTQQLLEMCITNNPQACLVKCCDRLHNMETIAAQPPKKRYIIARETMDVLVVFAQKLGYQQLADTLAQHCKPYL